MIHLRLLSRFTSTTNVKQIIDSHPVILFMKGVPEMPLCGHSAFAVQLMKYYGRAIKEVAEYTAMDVSQDEHLREDIKEVGGWPTFPQLWVRGKLIGGSDILL